MDGQEQFLRLFLQCQGDLRAFIGSLIRDPHLREDVFQEVALVLWREFVRYDPARPFGAWARGIAANKVMQRWESDGRLPLPFSPAAIQAICDVYDQVEAAAPSPRAEALEHCLEKLPEKSRRLLALRYEKSLKLGQIAERVHASLDAVHKALTRIRARLLECIERRLALAEKRQGGTP
jgi:RNA polymerase sigma-70 factor (ECF subfamily)